MVAICHLPRKHGAEEHGANERGVGDDKERGNGEYTGSDSALTVLHKWEVQGTDATQLKLKVSKGEGFALAAASGVGVICVRGCKGARKP